MFRSDLSQDSGVGRAGSASQDYARCTGPLLAEASGEVDVQFVWRSSPPRGWSFQPIKAMFGKAPVQVADNTRLNTHVLGDRTRAAALRCEQHDPRPPYNYISLRRAQRHSARHALQAPCVSSA